MKPPVNDDVLRASVCRELGSDPEVVANHISVSTVDGGVTLRGHVMTIHEKHAAARAAERVDGVRAVADEIEVREPALHERADDEIAEEVAHRRGRAPQSRDSLGVLVSDGYVTLHGVVDSAADRDAAESEARQLAGVRAVGNLIKVRAPVQLAAGDVERRVHDALESLQDVTADAVSVTVTGSTAHLRGQVPSLEALEKATEAAEGTPGVTTVVCELVVKVEAG